MPQAVRFQSGETDAVDRLSAETSLSWRKEAARGAVLMLDLGQASMWLFLVFNPERRRSEQRPGAGGPPSSLVPGRGFSASGVTCDRPPGMARLVFQGRAAPLAVTVPPGDKLWVNRDLKPTRRSILEARSLLAKAGYSWGDDGLLRDPKGARRRVRTITNCPEHRPCQGGDPHQADLRELGIRVGLTTLESRATFDRILNTHDYDTAVVSFAGTDTDPNPA